MIQWTSAHLNALRNEHGATAVEYALMVGFIAAVIAAVVALFGLAVRGLFDQVPLGVFG